MLCDVTTPLHGLHRGSPHYGPWDKSDLRSHPAAKHILPIAKKVYICEKCVDLVECNISRKNHVTQDVWTSKRCAIAYVFLAQKIEEPWSI